MSVANTPLEAGELGDEFGHELEMDAIRWDDLISEKKHWLQQLNLLIFNKEDHTCPDMAELSASS